MSLQLTHKFLWIHNFKFKQIAMTMWKFIEIYWLEVLLNWAQKFFFRDFFGSVVIFEIHGCCSSELVDPTKIPFKPKV